MPATSAYEVRLYDAEAGDAWIFAPWWTAHGHETEWPVNLLPPVGVIVEYLGEPVAACWAQLTVGQGLAQLEYPITKPGMTVTDSKMAMKHAIRGLENVCRSMDYKFLVVHTLPGIARVLERDFGFTRDGSPPKITMAKRLD